jgi:hypothetical protein
MYQYIMVKFQEKNRHQPLQSAESSVIIDKLGTLVSIQKWICVHLAITI